MDAGKAQGREGKDMSKGRKRNGDAARRRNARAKMFEEQGGLCYYCQGQMTLEKRAFPLPNYASFEHVLPIALGGSGRRENLRLACWICNHAMGRKTSDELQAGPRRPRQRR
jgi:5-methylcytosine-specific restriction endonuclease McrA